MDQKTFTKHMQEKSAEAKKAGFEQWLNQPESRALISMIPANENPDLIRLILQGAFESGFASGQVTTVVELIKSTGGFH